MNLEIFDNGQGIKAVAVPDHPPLPGELPTWAITAGAPTGTDPDFTKALVLAVSADGLTCTGTLPNPPMDGTGFVLTISMKRNDGVVITDSADGQGGNDGPFDIVAHPTEPGAFVIKESAL